MPSGACETNVGQLQPVERKRELSVEPKLLDECKLTLTDAVHVKPSAEQVSGQSPAPSTSFFRSASQQELLCAHYQTSKSACRELSPECGCGYESTASFRNRDMQLRLLSAHHSRRYKTRAPPDTATGCLYVITTSLLLLLTMMFISTKLNCPYSS